MNGRVGLARELDRWLRRKQVRGVCKGRRQVGGTWTGGADVDRWVPAKAR